MPEATPAAAPGSSAPTPPPVPPTAGGTTALTASPAAPTPAEGTPPAPTDGAKPADSKPADAKPADAKAAPPAELELKFPDGTVVDQGYLDAFKAVAAKHGLSAEQAQAVADLSVTQAAAQAKAVDEAVAKQKADWAAALKTDKTVGGAQFEANMQQARKAIVAFGDAELTAFLDESGLGNHPAVVRAFFKAGKAISEDSVAGTTGAPAPSAATDEKAFLRDLYKNTPSLFKE